MEEVDCDGETSVQSGNTGGTQDVEAGLQANRTRLAVCYGHVLKVWCLAEGP